MFSKFSKRQRAVAVTILVSTIFLAAILLVLALQMRSQRPYQPGEAIEGLTNELARSLPANYPRVTFVDASREAKIQFQHFSGRRSTQLPEDMGSGAAWGDYDRDGWLDLYVVNQAGPLTLTPAEVQKSPAHGALYHNNSDSTFSEMSAVAGVDFRGWGMAAAWGDYDNDGWPDLFVSAYGKNVLYRNRGDGTFVDVTLRALPESPDGFWAGAAWGDYNRDGYLDLYVCGYVRYEKLDATRMTRQYDVDVPASINPSSFEPERNLLYRNNGDGTFAEVGAAAGVDNPRGRSLSAVWCDFDEDGWPDLYVANDVSDNALFRNLGNGAFKDISHAAWVADYRGAMGIAVGDWDRDRDMDMFITHWIAQENALFDNQRSQFATARSGNPGLKFMDEADRFGLGQIALDYIGWGTSFFDYNNDGQPDLFIANGSTFQDRDQPELLIPMNDLLFWNQGAAGFYDVSAVSGDYFRQKYVGRGAAFGDYDNDGDVDIFVVNNGGPGILLKNEGGNQNNWLKVYLQGRQSNRSAIGARLRLVSGKTVQLAQLGVQSSYCSQNSLIQHFGLGSATRVDSLIIIWPAPGNPRDATSGKPLPGVRQVLTNLPANQLITVVEGSPPQ